MNVLTCTPVHLKHSSSNNCTHANSFVVVEFCESSDIALFTFSKL